MFSLASTEQLLRVSDLCVKLPPNSSKRFRESFGHMDGERERESERERERDRELGVASPRKPRNTSRGGPHGPGSFARPLNLKGKKETASCGHVQTRP